MAYIYIITWTDGMQQFTWYNTILVVCCICHLAIKLCFLCNI